MDDVEGLRGHECRSALETHGLDPQVGFLHADRPGRAKQTCVGRAYDTRHGREAFWH
ncbi:MULTISPECIES: CRISPR-associated endonuclease Cas1 [Methylobacterium]|uniref:CRISPR-associated endonuclease Cas1 n=1 Tax=Methylobacterium TaxID=407 RepID=UPI00272E1036|nr:CRISPR-associated endonuclease Cas1 [Methylobacterium sp.]